MYEQARFNMIEQQIRTWDVLDNNILDLLFSVKRENFVKPEYKNIAFADLEIPLPGGQKMLCPKVEARLVQELKLDRSNKVLEIGTGSAYVTAILAKLCEFVYSVEIDEVNQEFAINNLMQAGINNIDIISGNGLNGLPNKAPYDRIFIGGALISIPSAIKQQLKVGGRLVGFEGVLPVMYAVLVEKISENEYKKTRLFETQIEYLSGENTKQFKF